MAIIKIKGWEGKYSICRNTLSITDDESGNVMKVYNSNHAGQYVVLTIHKSIKKTVRLSKIFSENFIGKNK
tara:strand:- start:402 stop:614 length:213 start_codon:yes stop_codon:yes gene_type:complete